MCLLIQQIEGEGLWGAGHCVWTGVGGEASKTAVPLPSWLMVWERDDPQTKTDKNILKSQIVTNVVTESWDAESN